MTHPAQRFHAPRSIAKGFPLKQLLDRRAVELLAESLSAAAPAFPRTEFVGAACVGLADLELKPRAAHIAAAMARHLPRDQAAASGILIASLGPELDSTAGNGLAPFFYLPHAAFIHDHLSDWEAGMAANLALTTRFTAEFSVRPFLIREPVRTLARLAQWIDSPNPHVRRLVSEGTRPRLPWAERLPDLVRDPAPALALLDALVDDDELYVRRSVANHMGDIAKDHPLLACARCSLWLRRPTAGRRWIVRHAVRLPARQGLAWAQDLRRLAGERIRTASRC